MQDWYFEDIILVFIIAVISLWMICSFSLAAFGIFLSFCSTVSLWCISTWVSFTLLGKIDYTCDNFWKFSINKYFLFLFCSPYLLVSFLFSILPICAAFWIISSAGCSSSLFNYVSPVVKTLHWVLFISKNLFYF